MAELVITLLQRGVADILHSPLTPAERESCAAPLPPPMIAGNHQSLSSKCFVGEAFRSAAVKGKPKGWAWLNESKTPRPKWGYVSSKPGSLLRVAVNTTASSGAADHPVLVQLAYLRSYEHMGKALVRCVLRCAFCVWAWCVVCVACGTAAGPP
jgi:DNA polymerase alpha subunit B